jgi:drug/metabolite transporter (DMT)-like permease
MLRSASPTRGSQASLEMLACAFIWGSFFVVGKMAVAEAAPLVVATLRFVAASAALLLLTAWREPKSLRPQRSPSSAALAWALGATGVAAYNALAFYGFARAPASDGAIISPSLNPAMTALVAALWLGEPFTRARRLGLLLSGVGVLLVFGGPALAADLGRERLVGDLCFLGSAVVWSAYTLLGKLTVKRFSALGSTTYASLTGLALLLPLAAPGLAELDWQRLTWRFYAEIAYLALGSTVVAFLLWFRAIDKLGAARTASYLPLIPIFGVAQGMLLLGERPGVVQLLGAAVAVAGVAVGSLRPRRAPDRARA